MNAEAIRERVLDALTAYPPLRESRCPLEVSVRDGTVELAGVVRTTAMKRVAENIALGVPGVSRVENRLLTDTELEMSVARRLASDEKARRWSHLVRVRSSRGHVWLKVRDELPPEAREALLEAARGTPGVRGVELDFRGAPV